MDLRISELSTLEVVPSHIGIGMKTLVRLYDILSALK